MIRLTGSSEVIWESSTFSHPEQTSGSAVYTFNHNMGKAPIENRLLHFNVNGNGVWSREDSGRDWAFNGAYLYRYSFTDLNLNQSQVTIYRINAGAVDCKVQLIF